MRSPLSPLVGFVLLAAFASGATQRTRGAPVGAAPEGTRTIWYVDGSACDGTGNGSDTDPFCRIQQAVDAAASGDVVIVRPGFYPEAVQLPSRSLAIVGEGGAEFTEVRAFGLPCFDLPVGGVLHLEGLSLSGSGGLRCQGATAKIVECRFLDSHGGYMSGGVTSVDSDLVVSACRFEGTTAFFGGAIAANGGTLDMEDCQLLGTWDFDNIKGGALWLRDVQADIRRCRFDDFFVFDHGSALLMERGTLAMEDCSFQDNFVGDYAGTVALLDVAASLRHCAFRDNRSSSGWGGALYVSESTGLEVVVRDCAFERNQAAEGGAACVRRGVARFEDCFFSTNRAGLVSYWERGCGGAIFVGGFLGEPADIAFASVTRCVFAKNRAEGYVFRNAGRGGAVFGRAELDRCTFVHNLALSSYFLEDPTGGAAAGGATLANSITYQNVPDQLEALTAANWSEIEGGWPGLGNLDVDPGFRDPEGGDLHLRSSSPCIDAGDPSRLDEDGSRLDLGAFPFDPLHGSVGRKSTVLGGGTRLPARGAGPDRD